MLGTGRTFYIAGAGIAGLTLALALAKFGANVFVLERNRSLSEFGAGLQISPNARHILDHLGLDAALTANSLEPSGIDLYPHGKTQPLVTLKLGAVMRERFSAPYAVMHRADLANVLYEATRRFANIDIQFGIRSWDVTSQANGVTVTFENIYGERRTARGQAFIGADGVHSLTRQTILAGPPGQYSNRVAWRTILPFNAMREHIALDRVSVQFGPFYHIVCYPLPHRQQVNIALFSREQKPQLEMSAHLSIPLPANKHIRVAALLEATANNWTPWPLHTVTTLRWHQGNIGLVGDAAHAMAPFQAQGAAMGIEDAAILAPLLLTRASAAEAFSHYARIRQPRVKRVARISANNGRIFHMPWPLSVARNLVISAQGNRAHLNRLDWLYDYKASLPFAEDAPAPQIYTASSWWT